MVPVHSHIIYQECQVLKDITEIEITGFLPDRHRYKKSSVNYLQMSSKNRIKKIIMTMLASSTDAGLVQHT